MFPKELLICFCKNKINSEQYYFFFWKFNSFMCLPPTLSISLLNILWDLAVLQNPLFVSQTFFLFITLIVFLSDQLINWDSGVPLNSATNKFGTPWIKNYIKNRFLNLLARYRKYIHILSNIWFTNHVCTLFIRYLFNTIFKLFLYCHFSSDTLQLMFVNSKYWGLL